MGFDVAYLTPVHPIGRINRKGPNNTLTAGPLDPGSPYAIGAAEGGHDALHPDLGTFEDFDAFVARAKELGLEVAMDIALQCAPDHPWVDQHPEWFTTRADGSIAYAENPPKKYQDIYPLNFDNDPAGIYAEVKRVVDVWIDHGVTLFRVDNPHTKPVEFWEWLITEVRARAPRGDLAGRGVHQAGDDAHPGQGRVPAVLLLLRLAQRRLGDPGVPGAADHRVRALHDPQLLADHPRHPDPDHAVRRSAGVQAARGAGGAAEPVVGHLHRLRARRARRPPRGGGAARQREVPVPPPRLRPRRGRGLVAGAPTSSA